jgi:YggT family protein
MPILGFFLNALANTLSWLLWAYMWAIIIRALLSWVNPDPWNPIVQFLQRITEPVLGPIRRRLPTRQLGLDLAPLVAVLAVYFLQSFAVDSLRYLAWRMR